MLQGIETCIDTILAQSFTVGTGGLFPGTAGLFPAVQRSDRILSTRRIQTYRHGSHAWRVRFDGLSSSVDTVDTITNHMLLDM